MAQGIPQVGVWLTPLTNFPKALLITALGSILFYHLLRIIIPQPRSWRKAATALFSAIMDRSGQMLLLHRAYAATLLRLGMYL